MPDPVIPVDQRPELAWAATAPADKVAPLLLALVDRLGELGRDGRDELAPLLERHPFDRRTSVYRGAAILNDVVAYVR